VSGHSKWATIKRAKAVTDAKRGNLFTKLTRAISIAARNGGDPTMNPSLRLAMEKAREANMPIANVERAIKKGTGELEGETLHEAVYEGFGPGGVAVLVNAISSNTNRTVSTIRKLFSDYGGRLGGTNSVNWMFEVKNLATVAGHGDDQELQLIDAGAEDSLVGDDTLTGIFPAEPTEALKQRLIEKGLTVLSIEQRPIAKTPAALEAADEERLHEFVAELEADDDVTSVFTNAHI